MYISGFSVSKVTALDKFSSEKEFVLVLETSTLPEGELSQYCRAKGYT
jgi:hypothetical protein